MTNTSPKTSQPDWSIPGTKSIHSATDIVFHSCSYELPKESVNRLTALLRQCQSACSSYPTTIHGKHDAPIAPKSYSHGDKPFAALLLSQLHICLQLCMHMLHEDFPTSPSRAALAELVHDITFVSTNLVRDAHDGRRVVEWSAPLSMHPLDAVTEEYQLSSGAVDAYSNDFTFDDLCYHMKILLHLIVSCCRHQRIAPWHLKWWRRLLGWEDVSDHRHDTMVLDELAHLQRALSLF